MSDEQPIDPALLEQFVLSQGVFPMLPEWSVGQQEYQPMDVGSFAQNLTAQNNMSTGLLDMLRAIMTGTFDYSTLEPVVSFDEERPTTAFLDRYRNTGEFDALFESLDGGMTAENAAFMQFGSVFSEDEVKTLEQKLEAGKPPHYKYLEYVDMAKKVEPEVALLVDWEKRRDAAPSQLSENAKILEAGGIRTTPYEDNEISSNIDQLRQSRADSAVEWDSAWDDYSGLQDQWVEGPSIQGVGQREVSGDEVSPLPPVDPFDEFAVEALGEEQAATDRPSPPAPTMPAGPQSSPGEIADGYLDFITKYPGRVADTTVGPWAGVVDDVVGPWADMLGFGGADPNAMRGDQVPNDEQRFIQDAIARSLDGVVAPSQNLQVPFDPESHYAPSNTLPGFNGPRGGMPRGADGGASDDEAMEELDPLFGQGLSRDWAQTPVQTEYEDIVPGVNDAGSPNARVTTYPQDEMAPLFAEMMGNTWPRGSSPSVNLPSDHHGALQRDRQVRRQPTRSERNAIDRSFSRRVKDEVAARVEENAVRRARERGAHPAFDQLMARYNSLYQGR